eukprot:TRINITY_DN31597_c0_g1_i1.p2 TRINITY_DN31597_c0_g1~~TRINITY_DN31597_c0_g1_i1.p2  ORF type:complete len:195 (-),score=78.13 TRINITY_DN31597_c0_g1_i1:184-768(-)
MFGCIVAGRLVQTNLVQVDQLKYAFVLEHGQQINYVVVFMTGAAALPAGSAASVYFQLPPSPDWQFLGYVSNEKPSAVFKVTKAMKSLADGTLGAPDVSANLGISIESVAQVQQQVALKESIAGPAGAFSSPNDVVKLAKRMLDHLSNYVLSFARKVPGPYAPAPIESIPVDAFTKWTQSFEAKIQRDPNWWKD